MRTYSGLIDHLQQVPYCYAVMTSNIGLYRIGLYLKLLLQEGCLCQVNETAGTQSDESYCTSNLESSIAEIMI